MALCLLIKKQFFYLLYVSRKQESLIWLQAKKGGNKWKENSFTDAAAAPTFYLEDLYEAYLNGTAVEDIAEGVIEFAKENNRAVIPNGIDVVDYESTRKHLGLMVIGAEENREYLETLVHEVIEGLALVPIVFINDDNSTGCIKIKKELLMAWEVTAMLPRL